MTIEFSCQHCGKALSTSEDKAGRKAKCPQCGEVITVPAADRSHASAADEGGDELPEPPPLSGAMKNCPMCGERIPASAKKCEFCGEEQYTSAEQGPRGHRQIEAGQTVSAAWEIFKKDMGLTIGGVIVFNLLNMACGIPQQILNVVATSLQGQGDRDSALVLQIISLCVMPLAWAGQIFLQVGLTRFTLNIARGEAAQIGDLFSGAKYFWRMFGSTILFALMMIVGFAACIVPGIILALMFAPYAYVLVDQDAPGIECLSRAKAVTKNNLGALFLIGLAGVGINILGALALCVGLIFTVPLTMLLYPVAYLQMTGQRTAA